MKKRFILLIILGIFFISCHEKEITEFDNTILGDEMRFDAIAGTRVATTENFSTTFEEGDAIGVFVVIRTSEEEQAFPQRSGNYAHNCKLVYNNEGSWNAASESDRIFFPVYDMPLDVYAYYPYQENADPTNLIFTIDTAQVTRLGYAMSDLMTARKEGVRNDGSMVSLRFSHKMALVQANVMGAVNPRSVRATLKGIKPTVKLDLSQRYQAQEVVSTSGDPVNIGMFGETINSSDGDRYLLRAVVPAQDLNADTECRVKQFVGLGYDKDTLCKTGSMLSLVSGKVSKYTITLGEVTVPDNHYFTRVRINPGTFMMGSPVGEPGRSSTRETQHEVRLTKTIEMSAYAVTLSQFCDFLNNAWDILDTTSFIGTHRVILKNQPNKIVYQKMLESGIEFSKDEDKWKVTPGAEDLPAVNVSWYGADAYAKWVGGRLPTEAEWEYACRAGTTTAYAFGTTINDKIVNFRGDIKRGKLVPVYSFIPNSWGLYNMVGNASEWCSDWMVNDYGGLTNVVDPQGGIYFNNPDNPSDPANVNRKVYRGGDFNSPLIVLRSASRAMATPDQYGNPYGLRVVFDVN